MRSVYWLAAMRAFSTPYFVVDLDEYWVYTDSVHAAMPDSYSFILFVPDHGVPLLFVHVVDGELAYSYYQLFVWCACPNVCLQGTLAPLCMVITTSLTDDPYVSQFCSVFGLFFPSSMTTPASLLDNPSDYLAAFSLVPAPVYDHTPR